ncbi:hypothetical protein SH2C18_03450 [Clostridium sediminicola]
MFRKRLTIPNTIPVISPIMILNNTDFKLSFFKNINALFLYLLNILKQANEDKNITKNTLTDEIVIPLYAIKIKTPNSNEINICFLFGSLFFISINSDIISTHISDISHINAVNPIVVFNLKLTRKSKINTANNNQIFITFIRFFISIPSAK